MAVAQRPAEDEDAIRAVAAAWVEATRQGDVPAVLRLMTDDALFLVPGQPAMDKAAFEAASRLQGASGMRFEIRQQVHEVVVDGALGFARSWLEVSVTPPGGAAPVKRAGHALTMFRKDGGHWRLWRDANMMTKVG